MAEAGQRKGVDSTDGNILARRTTGLAAALGCRVPGSGPAARWRCAHCSTCSRTTGAGSGACPADAAQVEAMPDAEPVTLFSDDGWRIEVGAGRLKPIVRTLIVPGLRVLVLHGKERAERFNAIPAYDLVLTTYPLVWRDIDTLKQHPFHLLVLDEAQAVKNAAGRGAEAVRQLQARHRLCLTGTPLENNLGELWAQFDFLLPGLLGRARDFTRRWRSPIEKQGHTLRAEALAARIRPFLLRRRKEDVAKELPPKTEVLRRVALEGAQRDLYETVRTAMDEQVRREIAAKGLARSHIMVLDALLKLRQVCCDPRLLKRRTLPEGMEQAKLDALDDMPQELVAEGRRILVLSQFAEMLALIAQRLQQRRLAHGVLTGRTRDRQAVVQRFQQGEVPVFLVSLKAGGVGLNLTAADTVIHFDPWWNPAAEAQATDRAHRIGQDKPVFVYKLVAAGSIEERILAMQQRKAGLAESVLGKDGEAAVKFGQQDIDALLAPLE
jgi:SNF2 family DNA or RNA helicase